MAGEFVDYKRGPGFWMLFEILIAVDITINPKLSAKLSSFEAPREGEDLYEAFDAGLRVYERSFIPRNKGW